MPAFVMDEIYGYEKQVLIQGPGDLRLALDYDDVDREQVLRDIDKVLTILNDHWEG